MARKSVRKAATKARPAARASAPAKIGSTDKPRSKSEILRILSEQTGVPRKQVAEVFDSMRSLIGRDLGKSGPGVFSVPGMMKVMVKRKPATKARKGINPFTGEETTFKARPARNVLKIRPLKALKELV